MLVKSNNIIYFTCLFLFFWSVVQSQKLEYDKNNQSGTFTVHDMPYLILGGELGNSSASNMDYFAPLLPKLKQLNLNTVLTPVHWELIEPQEGKFDFNLVDNLITEARKNDLKLILLWFGSWKNSMSCYVPFWVKMNDTKYPRAKSKDGKSQEILTPFSDENLKADKKAFSKLMAHLHQFDGDEKTVIMVQVENEIGMIPDARDYSDRAQKAFKEEVPKQLIQLLQTKSNEVHPHLKNKWMENGSEISGNWETIFGKDLFTDELFMAWYFAIYTENVAKAGKEQYDLPMYVNAALNSRGRKPGAYPSAGPLAHLFDIWKLAAPSIDVCAVDIYDKGFADWVGQYDAKNNPLFVPEIRNEKANAARVFYAIGKHKALGFSPFSIEDCELDDPIGKSYAILHQIAPVIAKTNKENMTGIWFDGDFKSDTITLKGWTFKASHDHTLGWTPEANDGSVWPETGALIISMSENQFLIAGTGVVITIISGPEKKKQSGILSTDRVTYENGKINYSQRLNGDQTHQGRHIRIPSGETDIQVVRYYQYQ